MRRAVIVFSSAGVCAIAAMLFLWSISPRSPAEGPTLDAHRDGDGRASTVAFADTPLPAPAPVPMSPVTHTPPTAALDRPPDNATASDNPATTEPKVEVAAAMPPAPASAPAPSITPVVAAGTSDVMVGQKNREFTVKEAHVKPGGTVKFVNDDTVAHNIIVTMPGGKLQNTGVQEPGQSASMQFTEPGKYDVECAIHPQMKMTVNVQ
jgi:plastocyanin